uniref:EF-hand domain-containing protein n=1 Tax=Hemiselmis andersenii TaxID=464988 RepID=A0A6U5AVF7_HEMAN|mmetsp:Transcript_15775/g.36372  ORF Transcript_15775/g.36372 Transcript_15775/m.36372 type:complete len:392 (-) Transcript_15775:160-1335(-)
MPAEAQGVVLGGLRPGDFDTLLAQAHKQFEVIDSDGNGLIEPDELRESFRNMGLNVTPAMIVETLGRMGLGPEDAITRDEWIKFTMGNSIMLSERQSMLLDARQVFEAMGGELKGDHEADSQATIPTNLILETLESYGIPKNAVTNFAQTEEQIEDGEERLIRYSELEEFLLPPADQIVVNSNLNDKDNTLLRQTLMDDDPAAVVRAASANKQPPRRQSNASVNSSKAKARKKKAEDAEPLQSAIEVPEFRKLKWLEALDKGLVMHHRNARKKEMEKTRQMIHSSNPNYGTPSSRPSTAIGDRSSGKPPPRPGTSVGFRPNTPFSQGGRGGGNARLAKSAPSTPQGGMKKVGGERPSSGLSKGSKREGQVGSSGSVQTVGTPMGSADVLRL